MDEWQVVSVLVTLAGLGVAIVTPIIKLNTNIVKLTASVNSLNEKYKAMDEDNDDEHRQLHERINHRKAETDALKTRVDDHEFRLDRLENK